jgi:hypothetical protein
MREIKEPKAKGRKEGGTEGRRSKAAKQAARNRLQSAEAAM